MEKELLLESTSHKRNLPFYGKLTVDEKGKLSTVCYFDSIYKYSLKNSFVSPYGLVFKNGLIVKESLYRIFNFSRYRQLPSFYKKILLSKFVRIEGNCIVAHHSWYDNYYHWLIEIMPRLFLLKDLSETSTLLIHENIKAFHKEMLAFFNFKEIVFIKEHELAKVKNITFPSYNRKDKKINLTTSFSDPGMNKNLLKETSKWIISKTAVKKTETHSKIYISRNKALHRRVLNEDELTSFLSSQGFITLYFEDYEFSKQVNFINNAKIIVGVCGAGLSNILFMKEGTHVINLIHQDVHEFCFYNIANCVDVNYSHFTCEGNQKPNAAFNDITVNINDLKTLLEQIKNE